MPYCPNCRAEFREGFTSCKSCGDVALVAALPETLEIPEDELEGTVPVGLASSREVQQIVEVDGRQIDLARLCTIKRAHELLGTLVNANIRCAMVPVVGVDFPDGLPRVEVRVRAEEAERAEEALRARWRSDVAREGTAVEPADAAIEQCPACGAHVPLDVEECPDCGLVVGGATDEEDEDEA